MAGARRARRPAHAGDEAHRRRRSGPPVPDAGLRAPPPRRGALERRGDREPGGDRGCRHQLRRRARPQLRAGRHRSGRSRFRPRHGGPDGERRLWRRSRGKRIRTKRAGRRFAVVCRQVALVRAPWSLARRDPGSGRRARDRRRLQRGPDRRGRLGCGESARRDPRLGAGAGRVPRAAGLGARGHLAGREPGPAPLHLVGLPGRQLPAQRGDADRPPPRERAGGCAGRGGGGRPRGPQGHPHPVRPRPARPRPGRARDSHSTRAGAARTSASPPAAPPRRAERQPRASTRPAGATGQARS